LPLNVYTSARSRELGDKRKMSFTSELLEFIKEAGELLPGIETKYAHARRLRRATYYGALVRLEKRGLIEKTKKKQRICYVPTDKGREYRIPRQVQYKKRMDGYSTVVIFDISETRKRERGILRRYLIRSKYTMLQKSVFISPNEFSCDLKELIEELNIRQNVTVLNSKIYYF